MLRMIEIMVVVLMIAIFPSWAEEPSSGGGEQSAAVVEDVKAEPFIVANKVCPVCGKSIDEAVLGQFTVDFDNKRYNICSRGHVDVFYVDPEYYSKVADDEMGNANGVSVSGSDGAAGPVGQ